MSKYKGTAAVIIGIVMGIVCAGLPAQVNVDASDTWTLTSNINPPPNIDPACVRRNRTGIFGSQGGGGCGQVHAFTHHILFHVSVEDWSFGTPTKLTASAANVSSQTWEENSEKIGEIELENATVTLKGDVRIGAQVRPTVNSFAFFNAVCLFKTNILPGFIEAKDSQTIFTADSPYVISESASFPNTFVQGEELFWEVQLRAIWRVEAHGGVLNKNEVVIKGGVGRVKAQFRLTAEGS